MAGLLGQGPPPAVSGQTLYLARPLAEAQPPLQRLEEALAAGAAARVAEALGACLDAGLAAEVETRLAAEAGALGILHAAVLHARDPEGARRRLLDLTASPEVAAQAHLALAEVARDAGDLPLALSHYERALSWHIDLPRARVLAGELRARLGPRPRAGDHPTLLLPQDRLGEAARRYRLLRELGRGGSGTVYLADDVRLGRRVAIKVLHPRGGPDEDRLLEARMAAGVSHPGVVRIFDVDPPHRLVAMEYLGGGSLRDRLLAGPLPTELALRLCRALCAILAAVHRRGVVHGDLKPGNVLFRRDNTGFGRPVLADFGVARLEGAPGARVAGTLGYMAPEVRAGAGAEARSDLFGLGVLLFEALAGQAPFPRGRGALALPPPRPLPPGLPGALRTLVYDLLAPSPEGRPSDAGEVLGRLKRM